MHNLFDMVSLYGTIMLLCCSVVAASEPLVVLVDANAAPSNCTLLDESSRIEAAVCGILSDCICQAFSLGIETADTILNMAERGVESVTIATGSSTVDFPIAAYSSADVQVQDGDYSSPDDMSLSITRGNYSIRYASALPRCSAAVFLSDIEQRSWSNWPQSYCFSCA